MLMNIEKPIPISTPLSTCGASRSVVKKVSQVIKASDRESENEEKSFLGLTSPITAAITTAPRVAFGN